MNELNNTAVLIDADNTQCARLEAILGDLSARGRILVKRAYGNWRKEHLKNWEMDLKRLAVRAVQQFDFATGKNATDMALVIDAMDLLYSRLYDTFVIVSSDSDYTPLALKLRESGARVVGVGFKTTLESFRNACDEFLFLEDFSQAQSFDPLDSFDFFDIPEPEAKPLLSEELPDFLLKEADTGPAPGQDGTVQEAPELEGIHTLLRLAYDYCKDQSGYAKLAAAGNFLKEIRPDFNCRTYGFSKLCQLLEAYPEKYEIIRYLTNSPAAIVAYLCCA